MIYFVTISCAWIVTVGGASLYGKSPYAPSPPGMRPSCAEKKATFCEEVDKYPTKLIQKLLQSKSFDMYDFFTDESEGLQEPPEHILHQEMTVSPNDSLINKKKRSITESSETTMPFSDFSEKCPIRIKAITPKLASNSNGEWRFIAQDPDSKTKQKVKVQLCDQSKECEDVCTQFYSPVPMLSIDKNGDVAEDIFWMPSSCQCFVESTTI